MTTINKIIKQTLIILTSLILIACVNTASVSATAEVGSVFSDENWSNRTASYYIKQIQDTKAGENIIINNPTRFLMLATTTPSEDIDNGKITFKTKANEDSPEGQEHINTVNIEYSEIEKEKVKQSYTLRIKKNEADKYKKMNAYLTKGYNEAIDVKDTKILELKNPEDDGFGGLLYKIKSDTGLKQIMITGEKEAKKKMFDFKGKNYGPVFSKWQYGNIMTWINKTNLDKNNFFVQYQNVGEVAQLVRARDS